MDKNKLVYSLVLIAIILIAVFAFLPRNTQESAPETTVTTTTLSSDLSVNKEILYQSIDGFGSVTSYSADTILKVYYKDEPSTIITSTHIKYDAVIDDAVKKMHLIISSDKYNMSTEEYLIGTKFYWKSGESGNWTVKDVPAADTETSWDAAGQKETINAGEVVSAYDEVVSGVNCRSVEIRLTDAALIDEFKKNILTFLPNEPGKTYELKEILFKRSLDKETLLPIRYSTTAELTGGDGKIIVIKETSEYGDFNKGFEINAPE